MREAILHVLIAMAIVLTAGCSQRPAETRGIDPHPTVAELPAPPAEAPMPGMAASVGIDGPEPPPNLPYAPTYEPIEYTPEQRAILAAGRPREHNWLEFYTPTDPERAVSHDQGGALPGINSMRQYSVARGPAQRPVRPGNDTTNEPGVGAATRNVGRGHQRGGPDTAVGPATPIFGGYDKPARNVGPPSRVRRP